MYFVCTGEAPFKPNQQVDTEDFNFWLILQAYQDSPTGTYPEMVDFLSKLLVVDPENRLTAIEALSHHWLNASPYQENQSLHCLQMKLLSTEEE